MIQKLHSGAYIQTKRSLKKDTCAPTFTAALFIIAKTWKQPKCSLTDEWIEKIWHIYTKEYYLSMKKDRIMPFSATWMELEILVLSKIE